MRAIAVKSSIISRSELLAGLLFLTAVNGLVPRIIATISSYGWLEALFNTFNTSVIVWAAFAAASYLMLLERNSEAIRRADIIVAFIVLCSVALPVASLSLVTLSLLSAYVYWTAPRGSSLGRSAIIFFALCVPMFWGPMLLTLAGQQLLRIDAFFVSVLLGTERSGNWVKVDDMVGLQIWPGCSSFHNISQAGLAWVALSQALGREWGFRELFWCALAMALAAAVNLGRLSLMGAYFEYFDTIHGPVGAQIASGLTLVLIAFICMFGLRRELFARD